MNYIFFFIFLCFNACIANNLEWSVLETTSDVKPTPSGDPAFVYDKIGDRLILFGGNGVGKGVHNEIWEFNLLTNQWHRFNESVKSPGNRFSMIFGLDDKKRRLIIATGQDESGVVKNDVWSFSLTSHQWTEIFPEGDVPIARYGSSGGLHPNGTIMFVSHGFSASERMFDTFGFDVTTDSWTELTPKCSLSGRRDFCIPRKRCLGGGTAISPTEFMLYGGCTSKEGPCPLRSTWKFDSEKWHRISDDSIPYFYAGPSARIHPTMVTVGNEQVLLFGGKGDSGTTNELSVLKIGEDNWKIVDVVGDLPLPRASAGMVAIDDDTVIMFGGTVDDSNLWKLTGIKNLSAQNYKYDTVISGLFIFCMIWIVFVLFLALLITANSWRLRKFYYSSIGLPGKYLRYFFETFTELSFFQVLLVISYIALTFIWLVLHYIAAPSQQLARATGHVSLLNMGALMLLFYYSHKLAIVGNILAILHNYTLIYYMIPSLLLFIIDLIIRVKKILTTSKDAKLIVINSTTTKLQITKTFEYKAGQFVWILVPSIGVFQWHPFSISSSPHDDFITCHIKNMGNGTWTNKLHQIAKSGKSVTIKVDGPYGNPSIDSNRYSTLILCAGGIGVTPLASILGHYYDQFENNKTKVNKVIFIWVCRDENEFDIFKDLIAKVQSNSKIEIYLHVTKSTNQDIKVIEMETVKDEPDGKLKIIKGRPNYMSIITSAVEKTKKELVGVMACGPGPMLDTIHVAISEVQKNSPKSEIHLHKEIFIL